MNKKGFTLVELLVVVAIIAVLSIIIVPSVITINNRVNKRIYEGKKENIESSATLYASNNSDRFNGRDEIIVTVTELIQAGYITADTKNGSGNCNLSEGCIVNPTDNTFLNSCYVVITKYGTGYRSHFYCENNNNDDDNNSETLVDAVCYNLNHDKFVGQTEVGGEIKQCGCDSDIHASKLVVKNTSQEVTSCIIAGSGPNNYLKYESDSGAPNWRVLGLEKLPSGEIAPKIITNAPI